MCFVSRGYTVLSLSISFFSISLSAVIFNILINTTNKRRRRRRRRRRRKKNVKIDMVKESWTCRHCLETEYNRFKVMAPCSCNSELRWVHRSCLSEWRKGKLSNTQATHCPTCCQAYCLRCPTCKSLWKDQKVVTQPARNNLSLCRGCTALSQFPPCSPNHISRAELTGIFFYSFIVLLCSSWFASIQLFAFRYIWLYIAHTKWIIVRIQLNLLVICLLIKVYATLQLYQVQWVVYYSHIVPFNYVTYVFTVVTTSVCMTLLFQELYVAVHIIVSHWADATTGIVPERKDDSGSVRVQHRMIISVSSTIFWIVAILHAHYPPVNPFYSIADDCFMYVSTCIELFVFLYVEVIRTTLWQVCDANEMIGITHHTSIHQNRATFMEVLDQEESPPVMLLPQYSRIKVSTCASSSSSSSSSSSKHDLLFTTTTNDTKKKKQGKKKVVNPLWMVGAHVCPTDYR